MQISVDSAVAYLESRGFVNKKQNLRLLKKANYNAELVVDFLAAKQALVNATNSDDQKKPFGLRRKLAKETQPELFAKFIEAKKALHSRKPSDIPVESEEPLKDKRCPLTKEERIARKEQRLRLKSQLESKEEEERTPVASPSPISHASVALDDDVKEDKDVVEPKKRNFLTKEERIARKLQRIQLKAANINNKDLNLKTEEEEDNSTAPAASEEQVPRHGRLSKEERLARKETRLRMKLSKLSQKQNQEESKDIKQEDIDSDATIQRRGKCVGKLTKEEKLARKEERLKLKEARLNLKQQRLAKREGIHIAPRVTTVFIDGSSFSKSQSEIAEMAKTLVEKNSQVEKIVVLYEGVEVISQSMEKIVIASATPLFESVQDAVKILALKIADKKTMSVISGNKSWIQEMRKEGVSAIVPFF